MGVPLLCTEDAITYLVDGDMSRAWVRRCIYDQCKGGYIHNYGGTTRGMARWNPRELEGIRGVLYGVHSLISGR